MNNHMKLNRILWEEEVKANESVLGMMPASFNQCDHVHIEAPRMGTVVIETPFGLLTVCTIPHEKMGGGSVDIKFHDRNDEYKHRMLGFTEGSGSSMPQQNLYALAVEKK